MPTSAEDILSRLKKVKTLRTLPTVVRKICLVVEEDNMSSSEVGRIIATDSILTARVLRLVNSSFYGFPKRIATVTQALVLLGFNVVKGLMLSASIVDYMTESMQGLWEHSLGCSLAAGMIARRVEDVDPEEAQVAGLLHDLGKVVVAIEFPDECEEILDYIEEHNVTFFEAEKEVLSGVTHLRIVDFFLEEWNLPEQLREPIACHHDVERAKNHKTMAVIVQLADALVRAVGFGYGGDPLVPLVKEEDVRRLGLDDEALREIISALYFELENVDVSELAG